MLRLLGLFAIIAWVPVASAAAQASSSAQAAADGPPKQPGLEWKCGAVPSFSALCRTVETAIEDLSTGVARFRLHEVVVEAADAGRKIFFDFKDQPVQGDHAAELLLMADGLLPPYVTAITLKNVILESTLALEQTTFSRALTLEGICLAIGDCTDPTERQDVKDPCSSARASLSFDGVTFDGPVILENIAGCGNLYIIGSKLGSGLLIIGDPSGRTDHLSISGKLFVNKSEIKPELFVRGMSYDRVGIALSDIETAQFRDTSIRTSFNVRDSELFSLLSYSNDLGRVDVKGNHVQDSLNLSNLRLDSSEIYLGDNRIDGRLALGFLGTQIEAETGQAPRSEILARLHGNRIAGAADIFVAEQLSADIDLRGSRFQSELVLSRARANNDGWLRAIRPEDANSDDTSVHLDFTATSVGTLAWNLPKEDQSHTWEGDSFRYTHWDHRQRNGLRPYEIEQGGDVVQELKDWVERLDPSAESVSTVDPLTYAADYLESQGHVAQQASIRRKALLQDFANRVASQFSVPVFGILVLAMLAVLISARPVRRALGITPSFAGQVKQRVASLNGTMKVAGAAVAVVVLGALIGVAVFIGNVAALFEKVAAFIGNLVFLVALFPVGWGARPEWAILLMALVSAGCWLIYLGHRRQWQEDQDWFDRLAAQQDLRLTIPSLRLTIPSKQLLGIRNVFVRSGTHGLGEDTFQWPSADLSGSSQICLSMSVDTPQSIAVSKVPDERTHEARQQTEKARREEDAVRQYEEPAYSLVPGFCHYDTTAPPRYFYLFLYSLDAMIPVINLHHFNRYYPLHASGERPWIRWLSIAQHGVGWWLSTIFVASLII